MRDLSALSGGHDRYLLGVEAIDGANADDPSVVSVRGEQLPLALAHGRLAVAWVGRLLSEPSEAVLLAARAHHLRRWELPRSGYPEGRPGYLRWRRDQKRRHADDIAVILEAVGYDEADVTRTQALTLRDGLGSATCDPESQAVEDAACLVFLETQLVDLASRVERERMVEVIRKTAAKMSPAALALVAEVPLDTEARTLLALALQ